MKSTVYDLLIGNLWQVKPEQIALLRNQFNLPPSQLSSLNNGLDGEPIITHANKIPSINNSQQINSQIISVNTGGVAAKTLSPAVKTDIPAAAISGNQITSTKDNPMINSWEQLTAFAINCKDCKLCSGRTQVVIERGNREARWMFIGEGPGEQEDLQGKPFVGASGQLLDKMIAAMGLNSSLDIYIANVVKCRPPMNRNPEPEEIMACSHYLFKQIELVKPTVIITLGRFAAQTILNTEMAVGKLRRRVHHYQQIPVIVTYHPSYLLRTPTAKKDAWDDLQLAMKTYQAI